jgi:hypothetical protein
VIRETASSVYRNHHDTWSFTVEAVTDDGVHVTLRGRATTKRDAEAAAKRAVVAVARCVESLEP